MNNKPVTLLTPNGKGEVTVQPFQVEQMEAKGFTRKKEASKAEKGKEK